MIDCSKINARLFKNVNDLISCKPKLSILLSKTDSTSLSYLKSIKRLAKQLEIIVEPIYLNEYSSSFEIFLLHQINVLNEDASCHGILLMRDSRDNSILPTFILAKNNIAPEKDIEGNDFSDDVLKVSCTARACLEIIESECEVLAKDIVIVGYGKVVGKPLAYLLMRSHAGSVTTTHSYTENMNDHLERADIIISAVGKPHFLRFTCYKEQLIIDAGVSRDRNNKMVGDIHPDVCKIAHVTPVPGGVGPITSLLMLKNVILASIGKF